MFLSSKVWPGEHGGPGMIIRLGEGLALQLLQKVNFSTLDPLVFIRIMGLTVHLQGWKKSCKENRFLLNS